MAKLTVQTTQNVEIDFSLASVGVRILSALIDIGILIAFYLFAYYMMYFLTNKSMFEFRGALLWISILATFIPFTCYSLFFEYLLDGQSLGKKLMRIKVVSLNGDRLKLSQILLRWMLKPIDMYAAMSMPLVGLLSMGITKHTQRVGDLVANTTVVSLKREVTLEDTILRVVKFDYEPVYQNVLLLSDKDIRIIKNTLDDYDKNKNYEKIEILGIKAKELLGIPKETKNLPMLRTILKDYNALANKADNKKHA